MSVGQQKTVLASSVLNSCKGGTAMEAIEIITALLLSLSFLLLVWTVKGFLLRSALCGAGSNITIVVKTGEKTKDLERKIAALRWLREDGRLQADILIVDMGMDEETASLAESIRRSNPSVQICRPDEIANIITRGIRNGAKG